MELEIRSRGFELTEALRTHCERRMGFALDRFAEKLGTVRVRLSDENGPRGGVDKRCRVLIAVRGAGAVVLEENGEDLYRALDRVADRTEQTLLRVLKRGQETLRGSRWMERREARSGSGQQQSEEASWQ